MKKTLYSLVVCLLALFAVFSLAACSADSGDVWNDATYTKDTSFGSGSKTVNVEVQVGEHSVTFTLHTDKENLADALLEHDLVDGSRDGVGFLITKVNGITADWNVDQSYWTLNSNGTMLMTGADSTPISDGAHFEFVYTK